METIKNKKKRLISRFLKEKNIFIKCQKLINSNNINCFDTLCTWATSQEGHKFWLLTQCDFIFFMVNYDKDNECYTYEEKKFYLHRILTEGYFSSVHSEYSKDTIEYKNYVKEYKKTYGENL